MKEFNWEEFKDKNNYIAVHCKTRDEAINFFKQMHKHNMRWRDGISYLETTTTHWEKYEAETTYSNRGAFCSKQWYEKHHYTILEWSGYMQDITAEDKKNSFLYKWCLEYLTYRYSSKDEAQEKLKAIIGEDNFKKYILEMGD